MHYSEGKTSSKGSVSFANTNSHDTDRIPGSALNLDKHSKYPDHSGHVNREPVIRIRVDRGEDFTREKKRQARDQKHPRANMMARSQSPPNQLEKGRRYVHDDYDYNNEDEPSLNNNQHETRPYNSNELPDSQAHNHSPVRRDAGNVSDKERRVEAEHRHGDHSSDHQHTQGKDQHSNPVASPKGNDRNMDRRSESGGRHRQHQERDQYEDKHHHQHHHNRSHDNSPSEERGRVISREGSRRMSHSRSHSQGQSGETSPTNSVGFSQSNGHSSQRRGGNLSGMSSMLRSGRMGGTYSDLTTAGEGTPSEQAMFEKFKRENPDSFGAMSRATSMAELAKMVEFSMPQNKMGSFQDFSPIMKAASTNRLAFQDGPLSLHDSYGAGMEQGDTQTHGSSRGLSASSNHLSESTTSLTNNRHPAPVTSPGSKQHGSVNKQSSVQSEVNGKSVDLPEPGIKLERLKNLSEEDLIEKIKEMQGYLEQIKEYHRGDGMRVQKMFGDMYWDYTPLRETIGDTMSACGYGVTSMKMLKSLNTMGIFKNDDIWFPTYYTYNTMWNFTDASNTLAMSLAENDAVRLLTLNCGHKPYINAIHSKNVYYVLKASLSILHNIARNQGMKHLFDENKTSETVMPFMQSEDEMLKILATLTIANIVDEEENKALIADTGTIQCIISWMDKALNLPRRRYKGFTPQELTEGLNKLAVNDANKMKIVEEGALPLFLKMLQHEDIREQSCSARVLWTLAFDKDVRVKINEFPDLVPLLEKLSNSTNKSLATNTHGALWILTGENEVTKEQKEARPRKGKSHVFLSYSWSDKEAVLQIRDRLRAEGYAIWIDIEKMGGSTLQMMAEAVQNAAVVIICMSEKYKQSPNCRTEAEYTFQLRKEYIPLMMQKKYQPDGWLSIILGAKLYFDFSGKYSFDKSFQGLLKELRGRGQVTPGTTPAEDQADTATTMARSSSHISLTATPNHHSSLHNLHTLIPNIANSPTAHMGQEELIKWLRSIKLTECIPAFLEFDGRLLLQLKVMRVEAPEFFYQCLEKRLNMSLIEILKFTRAIEELP